MALKVVVGQFSTRGGKACTAAQLLDDIFLPTTPLNDGSFCDFTDIFITALT